MYPNLFTLPDWVPFLGGEPITSFGVMMFLAFLSAAFVLRRTLAEKGIDPEKAWDVVFMGVIGGIVGAKLYYVLLNWESTVQAPLRMIFSRGGMVWYGGFFGATALIVWEIRKQKLPIGRMADAIGCALPIGYAVGRVGCFLVGDDWGRPTDLPWGIKFPQGTPPTTVASLREFGVTVDPALVQKFGDVLPVHPTQLYEVGISLAIFALLWGMRKHGHRDGWLFMLWLVCAGCERFFVEIFRAKDDRFLGPMTIAQVISLGLIAFGAWGLARLAPAPVAADGPPGERKSRAERRRARA